MSVTIKRFIDVNKGVTNGIESLILKEAIKTTSQAKALAPVDLGQLRNSIMYKTNNGNEGGFNDGSGDAATREITDPSGKEPQAYVGTATEYGIYQEYGTRTQEAQPYLRPAIDIVQNRGKGDSAKILADAMRKAKENSVKTFK